MFNQPRPQSQSYAGSPGTAWSGMGVGTGEYYGEGDQAALSKQYNLLANMPINTLADILKRKKGEYNQAVSMAKYQDTPDLWDKAKKKEGEMKKLEQIWEYRQSKMQGEEG